MNLSISEVTPADSTAFAEFHDVYLAAELAGRPFATPWQRAEMAASVAHPSNSTRYFLRAGRLAGAAGGLGRSDVVAVGWAQCSLKDNLEQAEITVAVHPAHQRRGYGSAMLADLELTMAAAGRPLMLAMTDFAYDLGTQGRGAPGVEFLLQAGYRFGLGDVQRRLLLPVSQDRVHQLMVQAAPAHTAYELFGFTGPVPDDIVESYGRLIGTLVTEAPMGDISYTEEVFDIERIREGEAEMLAAGRERYAFVAVDRSLETLDQVVAYTEIITTSHEPGRSYQWGTLVRPEHRGRRLGVALKARNLDALQRLDPSITEVITWNAEVNEHMIAVNELFGFTPVARAAEFEKRLG